MLFSAVPISFIAMCTKAMYRFPRRLTKGDSRFLRSFAFLFYRFKAASYWYSLVYILRSALIALVPVIPNSRAQVIVIEVLLFSTTLVQAHTFPWRVESANYLDCTLSSILITTLCCASFLVDGADPKTLSLLCSVLLVGMMVLAVTLMLGSLATHFVMRRQKEFQYFITHHKADAAAQARLLKMMLQRLTARPVFIDSDNLQNLDFLFEVVRSKVQNLIVYLTSDTLSRPWCAGEIVTAYYSKVPIILVRCQSFKELRPHQIRNLRDYVDLVGSNVLQYGITYEDLEKSYLHLQSNSFQQLNVPQRAGVIQKFAELADMVLVGRPSRASSKNPFAHHVASEDTILISAASSDDEATAAACILLFKVQEELFVLFGKRVRLTSELGSVNEGEAAIGLTWALVIMLSQATLMSVEQLEIIAVGSETERNIVSVKLPSFKFPGDSFYSEALPRLWPDNVDRGTIALQNFFKFIAVDFTTYASDDVLETQASSILERVRQGGLSINVRPSLSTASDGGGSVGGRVSFRLTDSMRKMMSTVDEDQFN